MNVTAWVQLGMLCFISVASWHHFGWTGIAIPFTVYLLMPLPASSR